MRVVHIIDSGGVYGAEAVVLTLAAECRRLGHESFILSTGESHPGVQTLESAARERGIGVVALRIPAGLRLRSAVALQRRAASLHPDIVHLHGYKPDVLMALLPRRGRPFRVVATVHGYTQPRGIKAKAYRFADRLALARFDRVVAVHPGGRGRSWPGSDRHYSVIENGIDIPARPPETGPPDERLVEFCRRRPVVASIGRLSREKGHVVLLHSLRILASLGQPVRLVILGEGPEHDRLTSLVRQLGLQDGVLMPGFVRHADSYLSRCDAFVLPSLSEGLPITLLEAMSQSVPVVASRVGGIPAVLDGGRCGRLVPAGDARGLAQAIREALSPSDATLEMVARARERVLTEYAAGRMAQQYVALYAELLPGRP